MKVMSYLRFFVCFTTVAIVSNVVYAKNVAVLVGVDQYSSGINRLYGAVNDVRSMKEALINSQSFQPENITTLTDGQATQKNILKALNDLEYTTSAGDEILIYFSGHGTSIYDGDHGKYFDNALSGKSGAFIPVDYDMSKAQNLLNQNKAKQILNDHLITGQYHIRPLFLRLEKDRHITAIMDSCYSQHSSRFPEAAYHYRTRTPTNILSNINSNNKMQKIDESKVVDEPYPYTNVVTFAASSASQKAQEIGLADLQRNPSVTHDGKPHGLFTDILLRVLTGEVDISGTDGVITNAELNQYLQTKASSYPHNKNQKPNMQPALTEKKSSTAMLQRPFLNVSRIFARTTNQSTHSNEKFSNQLHRGDIEPLLIKINGHKEEIINNIDGAYFTIVDEGLADFEIKHSRGIWTMTTGAGEKIITTRNIKNIRERINTAHWLKQLKKEVNETTSMQFSTLPVVFGNIFFAHDEIQFATKVNVDSALLVINIIPDGSFEVLYPVNRVENQMIPAHTLKTIPEQKMRIIPPYGFEQLVAISLKQPLSEAELNQLSALTSKNSYNIHSEPINKLADIIRNYGTNMYVLNVTTYPKSRKNQ